MNLDSERQKELWARRFEECEHSRHVAQICGILARKMGVSHHQADMLELAALHHDEGKLAIPTEILNKPGKLTPEEFTLVKTHTRIGSELLADAVSVFEVAMVISRYHHEHWDGCGGYEGLKGENIPWTARVTGLADVVDALLSDRPYKKAWSFHETLAYVEQERGHHFDPAMVDVLLSSAGEIEVIYKV